MINKLLIKNKEYLICISLLLIVIGLNIYNYIDYAYNTNFYPIEGTNAFSFWYYVRTLNMGQIIIFISPIIIVICSISKFYDKLSSGIYMNILLKKNYNKFIKKEITLSYVRGALILPITSLLIFVIGLFIFGDKITIFDSSIPILYLPTGLLSNPYLYVFLSIILVILYSILIINISLILIYYIKKFYLLIIGTFITINTINFCVSNVLILLSNILKNQKMFYIATNINIYDGYSSEAPLVIAFSTIIVYTLISSLLLYIFYRRKERLLSVYD